ncbi:MAG: CDP-alcohol phosphatidyltransferase family protein [Candidatus Symbiobacter sp.]|nr:CDP-alcohol phosphatidyltransferase family protein [Candidatus Symbiobacter sp.]
MKLRSVLTLFPLSLTFARLCSTPLAVWALTDLNYVLAFYVFCLAALTDALDGMMARLLDARTTIGSYLDPIADKLLLVAVFVMLGTQGLIPVWLVILVVFRDAMIIGAVMLFHTAHRPLTVSPALISKLNSLAQFIYVGLVLASQAFSSQAFPHQAFASTWENLMPDFILDRVLFGFILIVAVTTLSSGGVYLSRIFNLVSVNDERK